MKRAQIIGISVAGVTGLLAFVMMNGLMNKKPVVKEVKVAVNATEVLVARADIALGAIANESNFRWQAWPTEAATGGFITRSADANAVREFSGAIARAPIMAGEPVTSGKLIKAGHGGVLAAILPAGMRAISVKIKEETSVGRLILPNDRVDVILVRRVKGRSGADEHVSDTVFRNVRVLAIGQQIEIKEGKKSAEGAPNTATLELTSRQAEMLALADSMGEISLSLRSIVDVSADGGQPTDTDGLAKKQGGNSVGIMRYGARSRAYGVN